MSPFISLLCSIFSWYLIVMFQFFLISYYVYVFLISCYYAPYFHVLCFPDILINKRYVSMISKHHLPCLPCISLLCSMFSWYLVIMVHHPILLIGVQGTTYHLLYTDTGSDHGVGLFDQLQPYLERWEERVKTTWFVIPCWADLAVGQDYNTE